MIHAEEHTLGNRHLHSWADRVNFLERCFLLPLSNQAVGISLVNVCTVPHKALQNLPLYWLVKLAACSSVLNWAWGEEERVHRNAKEGGLRQAAPSQDSCFWLDCIITGGLSMEPGFAKDGSKIIMSVMGNGRTKHQWRQLDWSCAGDNTLVGATFFSLPWAIVKKTSLASIITLNFS